MRDILKRIFIGVAIGMALFFLKSQVFAATITPTSKKMDVRYTTLYCDRYDSNGECIYDSWGSWSGQVDIGSSISSPNGNSSAFNTIGWTLGFGSDLVAGNTYNFTFKITLTPSTNLFALRSFFITSNYFEVPFVTAGTTSSNRSPDNISSFAYRITKDSSGDNKFVLSVSATLNSNARYISIYLRDKQYDSFRSYLDYFWGVTVTSTLSTINYSESSNSYIQQTTQAVINLTTAFLSGNKEMLDVDEPASKDFPSDYDTTDYDNAEQSISSVLDSDVSNLTWDPTTWINAFNWIFGRLTNFVKNLNNKVFFTYTAFLTFSFVGLVLNR